MANSYNFVSFLFFFYMVVVQTQNLNETQINYVPLNVEKQNGIKNMDELQNYILNNLQRFESDFFLLTTTHKKIGYSLVWPDENFALPKPITGCPMDILNSTNFEVGWRYHDTENDFNENSFSENLHIDGSVTGNGILHKFCTKRKLSNIFVNKTFMNIEWPRGKYCIYQYGETCPRHFLSGMVIWTDESVNNKNSHGGALPSGVYDKNTLIRFCCKNDGDPYKKISLPFFSPFYLFPFERDTCQQVLFMNSTMEHIKFDDEDENNQDSASGAYPYGIEKNKSDHILYLCYYVPIYENGGEFVNFFKSSHIKVSEEINLSVEESGTAVTKYMLIGLFLVLIVTAVTFLWVVRVKKQKKQNDTLLKKSIPKNEDIDFVEIYDNMDTDSNF